MQPGMSFGTWLKQRRKALDLTQDELAQRVGCSVWTIIKIEADARRPSRQIAERLIAPLEIASADGEQFIRWARTSDTSAASQSAPAVAPIATETYATSQPFIVGLPIQHPRLFWGRTAELVRIYQVWQQPPLQNVALIGPKRSGKTSLLYQLKALPTHPPAELRPEQRHQWLPAAERYRWIFVDFQDARLLRRERLLRYLLRQMGLDSPASCDIELFMDIVADQLEQPTLILMDEVGSAIAAPELDQRFWDSLRSLASHYVGGLLGFALAAHEHPAQLAAAQSNGSPFFNLFGHTYHVGPLDEHAARALIASAPLEFAAEDVEWILAQSGAWPSLVQALSYVRLMALQQGDHSHAWRITALQQIAPFRYLLEHSHGRV